MEIRCGLDGSSANNRTLEGGMLHVLGTRVLYNSIGHQTELTEELTNITFRGLTFSGLLQSSPAFQSLSVLISTPSQVVMDDCVWTNSIASTGVIGVHEDLFQVYGSDFLMPNTIHLTIQNSIIKDSVYDGPILRALNQDLTIRNMTVSNVKIADIHLRSCRRQHQNEEEFVFPNGCANFLQCYGQAICTVENVCVHDLQETDGTGLVIAQDGGEVSIRDVCSLEQSRCLLSGFDTSNVLSNSCERMARTAELPNCSCSFRPMTLNSSS